MRVHMMLFNRNIYNVYDNFTDFVSWFCQIIPNGEEKGNETIIYNCTVDGLTKKRYGDQCYYYEDLAAKCERWWYLACGINNFYQFAFLCLIMLLPVFIASSLVSATTISPFGR